MGRSASVGTVLAAAFCLDALLGVLSVYVLSGSCCLHSAGTACWSLMDSTCGTRVGCYSGCCHHSHIQGSAVWFVPCVRHLSKVHCSPCTNSALRYVAPWPFMGLNSSCATSVGRPRSSVVIQLSLLKLLVSLITQMCARRWHLSNNQYQLLHRLLLLRTQCLSLVQSLGALRVVGTPHPVCICAI